MNSVYDILEICLQEIEKGADIDSLLFRYPTEAGQLRPLLETAVTAIKAGAPDPSDAAVRRSRAKVLQQAALLRDAKVQTATRRLWSVPLRRALVTLTVVVALFVGSTGLVRASSMTLPGDNLYPVKRTWEDMHILLTFNDQARAALEVEHENERMDELKQLFTRGRSAQVDFSGTVTRQSENLWLVSGVAVAIASQSALPTRPIVEGDAIHVVGITQSDGAVLAQRVELLPTGVPLPEVKDEDSFDPAVEKNSGSDVKNGTEPQPSATPSSPSFQPKYQTLHGSIQSIHSNIWVVDGQIMNVSSANIKGNPRVGQGVKVEGYFDANGLFIVTKIEVSGGSSIEGSGSGSGGGYDNGGNDDNHPDDIQNDTEHHEDDSSNDSSGGGGWGE